MDTAMALAVLDTENISLVVGKASCSPPLCSCFWPGSGAKGVFLAFLLGSFAAEPLYGAFPVAAVLMEKGAGFSNIMIFIGT